MNPAEQIWKKLRVEGFCNEAFASQEKMVARLCATINHLAKEAIISLAGHIRHTHLLPQDQLGISFFLHHQM